MTVDALVWVPRMYYLLGIENKGLPEQWFTGTVLVRDLAVIGLCALVLRQIYHPGEDLVRAGDDDPAGGPCDGVADAPPGWLPAWLRPRKSAPHIARAHSVGSSASLTRQ
ncbi:putative integral membrane protein [Mycobacteroides abscessus]|nr:putative integral membrane protein [Mycobacteroides abscessus]